LTTTDVKLSKREIRVLLDALEEANRKYVSRGGSRDFAWEDEHDALEKRLTEALQQSPEPKGKSDQTIQAVMGTIIFLQIIFFAYLFLCM